MHDNSFGSKWRKKRFKVSKLNHSQVVFDRVNSMEKIGKNGGILSHFIGFGEIFSGFLYYVLWHFFPHRKIENYGKLKG